MILTTAGALGRRRPGRPRKADAGDTKTALQQAALRLFAQRGYAGTSVRAIASEVGLSESVLYAHFASKQAIFDAVLADLGSRSPVEVVEGLGPDLARTDPPRYLRGGAGGRLPGGVGQPGRTVADQPDGQGRAPAQPRPAGDSLGHAGLHGPAG